MWLCKLLIVLWGVITINVATANNVKLSVSLRKNPIRNVGACVHSFSQVELVNLVRTPHLV